MNVNTRKTIHTIIVTTACTLSFAVFAFTQNGSNVSNIDSSAGVLTMINVLTPA